jgi:AMP phosphorylase
MKLKIKELKFIAGKPVCMIHQETAKELNLSIGERIKIKNNKNKELISAVNVVFGVLKPKEIALSEDIINTLSLKENSLVDIELAGKPHSIELIKKKLDGEILSKKEIYEIIKDISDNSLTEVEVAFFISAVYAKGMSLKETKYLTKAMVKSGNIMKLRGKVIDKHCIGGIAGNKTTPLVVSICSAAGRRIVFPKTSSRAITSATGTADVIESIARVNFSVDEIKRILRKTKACLVWGGALGLAPVDDKIIQIERTISIDSSSQLLASILSKKISVGSKYLLIDIPYGKSAKVSKREANELKQKFLRLCEVFGLKISVILTDGREPVGNGVGPILEIKDILKILRRDKDVSKDLEDKAVMLSGKLLELCNRVRRGKGEKFARKLLDNGKAFRKFKRIIEAQEGNIDNIREPKFSYIIKSKRKTKIKTLDNKFINRLARAAGSPDDKYAGVYIHKKKDDLVNKNDILFTLYSDSKERIEYAKKFYKQNEKNIIKSIH